MLVSGPPLNHREEVIELLSSIRGCGCVPTRHDFGHPPQCGPRPWLEAPEGRGAAGRIKQGNKNVLSAFTSAGIALCAVAHPLRNVGDRVRVPQHPELMPVTVDSPVAQVFEAGKRDTWPVRQSTAS